MRLSFVFACVCIILHLIIPPKSAFLTRKKRFIPMTKCYGELGCLSTGGDFYNLIVRTIQLLPQSREKINVRFLLFFRGSGDTAKIVTADKNSILNSGMDLTKPLTFIVHGFTDNGEKQWLSNIRRETLKVKDANVIQVDWKDGARPPYTQATANTRLVGAEIAHLIKAMKEISSNFPLSGVHLIGHSLGAHTIGYAGKYFPSEKLGRITGLDPAGPYFEGMKAGARLSKTDATFVDAIHTNGLPLPLGLGMWSPVGQIDIYLNGGKTQPGCFDVEVPSDLLTAYTCSHGRVTDFYIATIHASCPHIAYRCSSYEEFKAGRCLDCGAGRCTKVGMEAEKMPILSQHDKNLYYMNTVGEDPYCGYHYGVKINIASTSKEVEARIELEFRRSGMSSSIVVPSKKKYVKVIKGGNIGGLLVLGKSYDNFDSITLTWKRNKSILNPFSWFKNTIDVKSIEIFSASTRARASFCSSKTRLSESTTYTYKLC